MKKVKKTMRISIKRIDTSLPLPEYKTSGSVCFDLVARETIEIPAGKVVLVPLNVIVQVPKGYMFMLSSRSSTAMKKGLLCGNGIGVIDQDYSGPTDEVKYQAYNFTDKAVVVEKGERVVQGCFIPVAKVEFDEVKKIGEKDRGGFGSTG